MSLPRFSVQNRILVNLVFLICAVLGGLAWRGAVVDVYPDVSFDAGSVLVVWPGASPEEIESSVTRLIETEILETKGLDRVISNSERDRALIDVKFREDLSDAAFDAAFSDLVTRVQRVNGLPDGVEEPVVTKVSVNELYPLLQVVVTFDGTSEIPLETLREVAWSLRERLRRIEGIRRVSNVTLPDPEWKIRVRRDALESTGLTLLEVAGALQARQQNWAAGTTTSRDTESAVGSFGESNTQAGLLDMVLAAPVGDSPVRLGDIADLDVGLERLRQLNRYNGRSCINLSVAKESDADALALRRAIGEELERFREEGQLPKGADLAITIDTTRILENRIRVLVDNLAFGIGLVFLVLWAFLGARNSFLAVIGIPFSFALAFAVLSLFGISINAITLFSLMLVSGMVVDDAIVVLENIYRRVERGMPLTRAVVEGTEEVFWPVIASSATTVAAFLPMLLMVGVVGEFMSIIPKTVSMVLLASLIECLLILPAHYLHWGSRRSPGSIQGWVTRGMERLERTYGRSLAPVMARPWLVPLLVILATTGVVRIATSLPVELFPSDFQAFFCNIQTDSEYGLDRASRAIAALEKEFDDLMPDQVEAYTTSVGVAMTLDNQVLLKPNLGQVLLYVNEDAGADSKAVVREVRERARKALSTPGEHHYQDIRVDEFRDGPPTGKPVAVRVAGPVWNDNVALAREIQDALRSFPGVIEIADNFDEGPREFRVVPKPANLARSGIPFESVARCVFVANEGLDLGEILPHGAAEPVTVRLQLADADRQDPRDLLRLRIRRPDGVAVPLGEVAGQEVVRGPASYYHYDGDRVVLVTADVDGQRADSRRVNQFLMERFQDAPRRYPGTTLEFGGEFEETQKSFESLWGAALVALVLIYTILATQFRSYLLPVVIISVVPFSFVGVVLGLWFLGFPFTILAFIAIVGLSGVVVNDSLVLLDFIVRRHRATGDAQAAVVAACQARLRAVILTTVTTVFGLLPMALGFTGHSRVWSPFAAAITFGLTLAMVLTLYLVPSVYLLLVRWVPIQGPEQELRRDPGET